MRLVKSSWIAWMCSAVGAIPRGWPSCFRRMRIASGLGRPITEFTTAGSASKPQAAKVARKDALTASPSCTVVPARSKTTSSIMVRSQPVVDNLLRQSEGESHAGPANAGYGQHARRRMRDHVGCRGVFDIATVPAGGDGQLRDRQESLQVGENQLVDTRVVEWLDGIAVHMRIAEGQLAAFILRY